MKYDPQIHHRRSIRLKGYDYSQNGAYFVTICTQNREYLFGQITDRVMVFNPAGQMVQKIWQELPQRFPQLKIDEFVVMPNHFHAILWITHPVGASLVDAQSPSAPFHKDAQSSNPVGASLVDTHPFHKDGQGQGQALPLRGNVKLGNIIGVFKSITTHQYVKGVRHQQWREFEGKLWQRNYFEHIIRNEESLLQTRQYIRNNPLNWLIDPEK